MKMPKILVALGLMVASLGISTSAEAQRHDRNGYSQRYDRGDHRGYGQRYYGHNRYDRRQYRPVRHWNRGNRYGWNNHRRCWTEWRHHRRVRLCR